MLQRTALIISTALTTLTLLVALALVLRVMTSGPTPEEVDTATADQTEVADQQAEQDAAVRDALEQLITANQALTASYQRIDGLSEQVRLLQEQNATLRQREATYAARLAEASNRLEHSGSTGLQPPVDPPNGAAEADPAAPLPPDEAVTTPATAPSAPVVSAPAAPAEVAQNNPPGLSLVVPGRAVSIQPQGPEAATARPAPTPSQARPTAPQATRPVQGLQQLLPTIDPQFVAESISSVRESATAARNREADHRDGEKEKDKDKDKDKKHESRSEHRERSSSRDGR
ncbi:MAG: hypothetical protein AB7P40_09445 [Chloroflexota bacterium]